MSNYQGKKTYQPKQSGGGYNTQYVPKQTKESATYETYTQYVPKQKQETTYYESSTQYVPKKTQDNTYQPSTQYVPKQKQESSTFGYEDDYYDDDYDDGYDTGYKSNQRGGGSRGKRRGGGRGGRYNKSYQGDRGQGWSERSGSDYYKSKNEGPSQGADSSVPKKVIGSPTKKKGYYEENEPSTKTSYQQQAQQKMIAEAYLEYQKLAQEAHAEEQAELASMKKQSDFGQKKTNEYASKEKKSDYYSSQSKKSDYDQQKASDYGQPKMSDFGHQKSMKPPSFALASDSTATSFSKGGREESKSNAMFGYDLDEDFGEQSTGYGDGSTDAGTYGDEDYGMMEDTTAGYYEEEQAPPSGASLVLMVAEKPSIAKSVAEALSNGKYKTRKGKNYTLNY